MPSGRFITPRAVNEKVRDYGPGSEDKRLLKTGVKRQAGNPVSFGGHYPLLQKPMNSFYCIGR